MSVYNKNEESELIFKAVLAFHNNDWMQLTRISRRIVSQQSVEILLQLFTSHLLSPWYHILRGCRIVTIINNYYCNDLPEKILLNAIINKNCNISVIKFLISIGCIVTTRVLIDTMHAKRLDVMEYFLKNGYSKNYIYKRPIFGCIGRSVELGRLLLKYGVDPYDTQCSASDHCYAVEFVDKSVLKALNIKYISLY